MPAAGDREPPRVGSVQALQDHEIGVERGVAAGIVGRAHQVRIEQGEHDGALVPLLAGPEALERVAGARHVAAPVEPLREQGRDQIVLRRDAIAAQIGVVEGTLQIEAPSPGLVDVKETMTEDVSPDSVTVLVGGKCAGDARIDGELTVLRALAILAG